MIEIIIGLSAVIIVEIFLIITIKQLIKEMQIYREKQEDLIRLFENIKNKISSMGTSMTSVYKIIKQFKGSKIEINSPMGKFNVGFNGDDNNDK